MKKLIIWVLTSILFLPIAFSYSLTPGKEMIYFEPGLKTTVSFIVNNYDGPTKQFNLVPSARSDDLRGIIDQVVYIQEPSVIIEEGAEHTFYVDIVLPDALSYGEHKLYINIFGGSAAKGTIGVQTLLAFKVVIYSLYSGKYLDAELLRPSSVNIGEIAQFMTSIHNLGTETIDSVSSKVEVYNAENHIASIYSDADSILSKKNKVLTAKLNTIGYEVGEYTARAFVEYDDVVKNATPTRNFNIGQLFIDIINISSKKFENNKINKFDIIIESRWNRPADVYADVIVTDLLGSEEKTRFKTQTFTIGGWKQGQIPAYFDIRDIENGNYKLKVVLYYAGKISEKGFFIEIAEEAGEAEIVERKSILSGESLLIIAQGVVIVILIAAFLILFFQKKKQGKDALQRKKQRKVKK